MLRPVLGEGLFLAEGEAWRHQRRVIAPALAPRVMPILSRHIVTVTARVEDEIAALGGRPVELMPLLQRLALDIAGQSMFSLEMAAFGADLRRLLIRYAQGYAKVGLLDMMLPAGWTTPLDRGRATFRRDWLALMDRVIAARDAQAPAGAPEGETASRDLFDLLRAARDPETGQGFDHALLRDEVSTLILAGHETTAVTLFWACYAMARLPEHQEAIAAEAAGLDLSPEHAAQAVPKLAMTRAVIDEALRLYPPAYLLVREAVRPDVVAGEAVAAGTIVSVSPWVLHRHEAHWDRPNTFDPHRFLPGRPAPDRMVYMPFGAGPAHLRRHAVRADRGDPGARPAAAALPAQPARRRRGGAARHGDDAAGPAGALPSRGALSRRVQTKGPRGVPPRPTLSADPNRAARSDRLLDGEGGHPGRSAWSRCQAMRHWITSFRMVAG